MTTSLPPFVLTRTANMRHLPAAVLQIGKVPVTYQVLCNISLRAYDPSDRLRPVEWDVNPARDRVATPYRLPECPRSRRRLVERESGRPAGKRSTVAWGAESRSERRPIPTHQNAPKTRQRGAQGVRRPSRGEPTND